MKMLFIFHTQIMNERRKLSLNNLPVVDLTKENVESEWNGLIEAIRSSSFVSIDVVRFLFNLR